MNINTSGSLSYWIFPYRVERESSLAQVQYLRSLHSLGRAENELVLNQAPWDDGQLQYRYPTYPSEPLAIQDFNVEPRLSEEELFHSHEHYNTSSSLTFPSVPQFPPQLLASPWSNGSSNQVIGGSTPTPGVNTTYPIPRQDPVGYGGDSSEPSLLSLLFDEDSSLEDFSEVLLPLGWEGFLSPPMQGALASPAPRQSDTNNEGGTYQENMQPLSLQTPSPQLVLSSTNLNSLRVQQSNDNFSAPVPSGSSSSRGGTVRTRRTAPHHTTPYTHPDSMPRSEPMSHQPGYLPWTCQWEGCNATFSSFKELNNHVLRPVRKDKRTDSVHKLARGHSTPRPCPWDNCSVTRNDIWRHILSEEHLFVRYECPTCGESKSRQRCPPPGHCC